MKLLDSYIIDLNAHDLIHIDSKILQYARIILFHMFEKSFKLNDQIKETY